LSNLIHIESLNLKINELELCNNLSFILKENIRIGITGPSGCGKTTFIKSIVKDDVPNSSTYKIFETNTHLPYSYVPQSSGLLPWFSLKKNVEIYGKVKSLTEDVIALFGLNNRLDVFPNQLSGGEYQRAILALAIINRPKIFVADEPLTQLDFSNKWKLLEYWSSKIKEFGASLILVSHDLQTLIYLCDKILILTDKPFVISSEVLISSFKRIYGD